MDNKDLFCDTFGRSLKISLFGGSHTEEIGVVVDGLPKDVEIDLETIQKELNRRRPGQNALVTARNEPDQFTITSGLQKGVTTGESLKIIIPNLDTKSKDYSVFKTLPRPSHVDYPAQLRYGKDVDLRGSGRFSGRMTAPLVAAGAIAQQILRDQNVQIGAYASQIGKIRDSQEYSVDLIKNGVETNLVRTVDKEIAQKMEEVIQRVKSEADSIGGVVTLRIEGFPAGVGDPWFHSLESDLAAAMMAIPGIRGIEFGTGFQAAEMQGSEHNDPFLLHEGKVSTKTNHCGGIIGGISIGTPIIFRVAVKPTASIGKIQHTLNFDTKKMDSLQIAGRHDPCIVPRVVVVLEAMTALVLLDASLVHKSTSA